MLSDTCKKKKKAEVGPKFEEAEKKKTHSNVHYSPCETHKTKRHLSINTFIIIFYIIDYPSPVRIDKMIKALKMFLACKVK